MKYSQVVITACVAGATLATAGPVLPTPYTLLVSPTTQGDTANLNDDFSHQNPTENEARPPLTPSTNPATSSSRPTATRRSARLSEKQKRFKSGKQKYGSVDKWNSLGKDSRTMDGRRNRKKRRALERTFAKYPLEQRQDMTSSTPLTGPGVAGTTRVPLGRTYAEYPLKVDSTPAPDNFGEMPVSSPLSSTPGPAGQSHSPAQASTQPGRNGHYPPTGMPLQRRSGDSAHLMPRGVSDSPGDILYPVPLRQRSAEGLEIDELD